MQKKNYFSCNLGFSVSLPNRNEPAACQRKRERWGEWGKRRRKKERK